MGKHYGLLSIPRFLLSWPLFCELRPENILRPCVCLCWNLQRALSCGDTGEVAGPSHRNAQDLQELSFAGGGRVRATGEQQGPVQEPRARVTAGGILVDAFRGWLGGTEDPQGDKMRD